MKLALDFQTYSKTVGSDRVRNGARTICVVSTALMLGLGGAMGLAHSATGFVKSHQSELDRELATRTQAVNAKVHTADRNVDVALMLDVTRSMQGDKLSGLKEAVKDFVDRIVSDNTSVASSRVALVPFAESVRLPAETHHRAVGLNAGMAPAPGSFTKDVTQWHWYYGWQTVKQTFHKTACVGERVGSHAFTDAAPGPKSYVTAVSQAKTPEQCGQLPSNVITPLTSSKTVLDTAVDKLTASSDRAAGHLGAAWAWYALSPKWKSIWQTPARQATAKGASAIPKFAILMSDGSFNAQYAQDGVLGAASQAPNGSSIVQTRQLCTAMKASGVVVYTVGLGLGDDTPMTNTLTQCATDASKAMRAANGKELMPTFRAIAQDITQSGASS